MKSQVFGGVMNVVIVTESHFGNTAAVGRAVGAGLEAAGARVAYRDATELGVPEDTTLVVLAAPTHNLGLSTPATRAKAAEASGHEVKAGIREWLAGTQLPPEARIAAVATTVASGFSGSAAKATLKESGVAASRCEGAWDFTVRGTKGPLLDGELDRARELGIALASGTPQSTTKEPAGTMTKSASRRGGRQRGHAWRWVLGIVAALIVLSTAWVVLHPSAGGDRTKLNAPLTQAQQSAAASRTVTKAELAASDGKNGRPAWVAVNGVVYDLTAVKAWTGGMHHGVQAGTDATEQFVKSGHPAGFLDVLPVVGRLAG